jgi:hypothetical protein
VSVEGHEVATVDALISLLGESDHPGRLVANAGDPISVAIRRDAKAVF